MSADVVWMFTNTSSQTCLCMVVCSSDVAVLEVKLPCNNVLKNNVFKDLLLVLFSWYQNKHAWIQSVYLRLGCCFVDVIIMP